MEYNSCEIKEKLSPKRILYVILYHMELAKNQLEKYK